MTLQIEDEYLDIIIAVGHAANMIFEKAYVVGGFVRDTIMGIPSDDLDFLCTDIDKLSDEILWHHGETKELYETITPTYRTCVIQWGNIKIDLVEPRKETYVSDSIKPLVEKGTFEDDIARRDFTINALTMGCSYDDLYYIYDRTNGLMD